MEKNENLAEKISSSLEGASSSFMKVYSKKDVGYIKLLALSGLALANIASFSDEGAGFLITVISLILILMAMQRVDQISMNTNAFGYMLVSAFGYAIISLIFLFVIATFTWDNANLGRLFSRYFFSLLIIFMLTVLSAYYYYKSYIELAKATNLSIFRTSAILIIVSIIMGIFSSFLSDIIFIIASVFTIIGWIGIKEIEQSQIEQSKEKETLFS